MNDHTIEKLLTVVAALRHPEQGCPWDRRQTYRSIVPHTLEEAYEVAEVIESGQWDELANELGDLLFQIVIYAQMASEQGLFEFADVVEEICSKLVSRHPHVFARDESKQGDAEPPDWEALKKQEKIRDNKWTEDPFDDVPLGLPALNYAVKIQKRAARLGFDWPDIEYAFRKLDEESGEVRDAVKVGGEDRIEDELGDLLFCCVNLCRKLKVDPEQALRTSNRKFKQRFREVKRISEREGVDMHACRVDELVMLWQRGKNLSGSS